MDWRRATTYLPPKSQLLLLLLLCDFIGCELLARDFALVEACEVFFARGRIEFDFLGHGDVNFALLSGWSHDCWVPFKQGGLGTVWVFGARSCSVCGG
jgi:hypothetical protein